MSIRTTKKTVAQLRAEIKQRKDDLNLGRQLVEEVDAFFDIDKEGMRREEILNPFLDKAIRACDLLQPHAHTDAGFDGYSFVLRTKVKIHMVLGQHNMAIATFRLIDEAFLASAGKRVFNEAEHERWRECIVDEGQYLLDEHQLEAAKHCFLRVLSWPYPPSAFESDISSFSAQNITALAFLIAKTSW